MHLYSLIQYCTHFNKVYLILLQFRGKTGESKKHFKCIYSTNWPLFSEIMCCTHLVSKVALNYSTFSSELKLGRNIYQVND